MDKVTDEQSLVPLAQELLALEAETFEVRDFNDDMADAMLKASTCSTSSTTSSCTSTTSCA